MKKTETVKVDPEKPDRKLLKRAAGIIRDGGLVAFPTETVYGLAANCLKKRAIERLYKVKKRPRGKPFTVHIAGISMISKMGCRITGPAKVLMSKFWPGPLTIILKTKAGGSAGFRMPANRVALELIKMSKVPVAAPSANLSGNPAPVSAKEVLRDLNGKIDLVIDAGRTKVGIESTVMDMTVMPPQVLREGAITIRQLKLWIK